MEEILEFLNDNIQMVYVVILSIIDNMNKGRGEIKKAENNSMPFKFIRYW